MLIELNNVTIAYPVGISSRSQSVLGSAAKSLSFGKLAKDSSSHTFVLGLNDVSLSIKEGDRIGLIGNNGSGKSTLLKTLAGILLPRLGKRVGDCTIGTVLTIGSGLDFEKSGYENLKFVAQLYGMKGNELKNAVDDAIDFADLGDFINLPVRSYSSGMVARLAFSIATAKPSDVMLIDEIIGTGDVHFIGKAVNRIKEVCAKSGAVVMASHSIVVLKDFCNQAVWLDAGKIKDKGEIEDIWTKYSNVG